MKRSYLEHIKIVSFGAFSNKAVGPFAPHLNVVYGPNEAGKTTLASFVGGVLFGWEEARGSRNTYKPANAERSGSLFFAQRDASSGVSSAPSVPSRRQRRRFPRLNPLARPSSSSRACATATACKATHPSWPTSTKRHFRRCSP